MSTEVLPPLVGNPSVKSPASKMPLSNPQANMQLQSRLFRLPRELRDLIYHHYLFNEAGLAYNFDTNKVPVDLSLMCTCRAAALELRGLALRLNKIVFRTSYTDATRTHASMFHKALATLHTLKLDLLNRVLPDLLTDAVETEISLKYPEFSPALPAWRMGFGNMHFLGEPASTHRDFIHFALNLLFKRTRISTAARRHLRRDHKKLRKSNPEPWQTPNEGTLRRGREGMSGPSTEYIRNLRVIPFDGALQQLVDTAKVGHMQPDDNVNYSFSAAACAIRFFRSLRVETLEQMRDIELIEDRESISFPECHVRGLIPFCREHPRMRVHRRVSLWSNVFPVTSTLPYKTSPTHRRVNRVNLERDRLASRYVSRAVAKWMAEASALPSLGMPEGSFKLTFECDSAPEETTQVFDIIQRDAAWQTALDLSYARNLLPQPDWRMRRLRNGYIYETFPQLLQQVTDGQSFIRCDFNPGEVQDPEQIMRELSGYSKEMWETKWHGHTPARFQTLENMPPWHLLRDGFTIWDGEGNR
ncbi:uncharacterized protein J4E78_002727 [Alternaria triticimaculans]|uniref:uncharacterized protein n=1 Tax=Alternaria triticimaculans TaxID=297637 RepID=UPI0020C433C8|nr:uncharacterized protein J4E78_002727 [Alternaria triticimaculans]KAI4665267.1 hypothetical protein J4E78_002727 [Alternaria triticimaculans]